MGWSVTALAAALSPAQKVKKRWEKGLTNGEGTLCLVEHIT
jgi:hypothetical protein